jgi:hypothetical protein
LIEILDFFDEHVWEGILGDWIGWLGMGFKAKAGTDFSHLLCPDATKNIEVDTEEVDLE